MDKKQQILDIANKGSAVALAYERALAPLLRDHRNQLYASLIACYKEGKHGTELFSVLGELSGLESLESKIHSAIKRGNAAELQLRELNERKNDEHESERRNY
jgi:hypothetical protein